jgi:hypothetical protein
MIESPAPYPGSRFKLQREPEDVRNFTGARKKMRGLGQTAVPCEVFHTATCVEQQPIERCGVV